MHSLCCEWHGGGEGLIFAEESCCQRKAVICHLCTFFSFSLLSVIDYFFFTHSGLDIELALGVCSFRGWNGGRSAHA